MSNSSRCPQISRSIPPTQENNQNRRISRSSRKDVGPLGSSNSTEKGGKHYHERRHYTESDGGVRLPQDPENPNGNDEKDEGRNHGGERDDPVQEFLLGDGEIG